VPIKFQHAVDPGNWDVPFIENGKKQNLGIFFRTIFSTSFFYKMAFVRFAGRLLNLYTIETISVISSVEILKRKKEWMVRVDMSSRFMYYGDSHETKESAIKEAERLFGHRAEVLDGSEDQSGHRVNIVW